MTSVLTLQGRENLINVFTFLVASLVRAVMKCGVGGDTIEKEKTDFTTRKPWFQISDFSIPNSMVLSKSASLSGHICRIGMVLGMSR